MVLARLESPVHLPGWFAVASVRSSAIPAPMGFLLPALFRPRAFTLGAEPLWLADAVRPTDASRPVTMKSLATPLIRLSRGATQSLEAFDYGACTNLDVSAGRSRIGATSRDSHYRVDPGKLTMVPLFAKLAAERVLQHG